MKKIIHFLVVVSCGISCAVFAEIKPLVKKNPQTKIQQLIAQLPAGSSHDLDIAYVTGAQVGTKPDSVQKLDLYVPAGKGPFYPRALRWHPSIIVCRPMQHFRLKSKIAKRRWLIFVHAPRLIVSIPIGLAHSGIRLAHTSQL